MKEGGRFKFKKGAIIVFDSISIIWIIIFIICILNLGVYANILWNTNKFADFPVENYIAILTVNILIIALALQFIAFQNQQTETVFFELIKNCRNNITDLKIENRLDTTSTSHLQIEGRDVFTYIFEQYCILFKSVNQYVISKASPERIRKYVIDNEISEYVQLGSKPYYNWIENTVRNIPSKEVVKDYNPEKYDYLKYLLLINDITYSLLFWGVKNDCTADLKDHLSLYEEFDINGALIKNINDIPKEKGNKSWQKHIAHILINGNSKNLQPTIHLFEGQRARIGNYFRHLFEMISYIDRSHQSLKRKKNYAKIIRSQLTDYQQALLFIDSISRLGLGWELNSLQGEKFITKYELIKNVSRHFVPFLNPNDFYPGIKFQSEELRLLNSN